MKRGVYVSSFIFIILILSIFSISLVSAFPGSDTRAGIVDLSKSGNNPYAGFESKVGGFFKSIFGGTKYKQEQAAKAKEAALAKADLTRKYIENYKKLQEARKALDSATETYNNNPTPSTQSAQVQALKDKIKADEQFYGLSGDLDEKTNKELEIQAKAETPEYMPTYEDPKYQTLLKGGKITRIFSDGSKETAGSASLPQNPLINQGSNEEDSSIPTQTESSSQPEKGTEYTKLDVKPSNDVYQSVRAIGSDGQKTYYQNAKDGNWYEQVDEGAEPKKDRPINDPKLEKTLASAAEGERVFIPDASNQNPKPTILQKAVQKVDDWWNSALDIMGNKPETSTETSSSSTPVQSEQQKTEAKNTVPIKTPSPSSANAQQVKSKSELGKDLRLNSCKVDNKPATCYKDKAGNPVGYTQNGKYFKYKESESATNSPSKDASEQAKAEENKVIDGESEVAQVGSRLTATGNVIYGYGR